MASETIWKYQLRVDSEQEIHIPDGSQILCVQVQNSEPCIWVKLDPDAPTKPVKILMFGTGHDVVAASVYIGSFQIANGALVFHVFTAQS